VDLGEGQLRGRVGPRADSPNVSHSDQVLGVSAAEYTEGQALVYYRDGWVGEKKRNEREESGGEVEVLSKAQHVPSSAA
jgi:hypothetical protein